MKFTHLHVHSHYSLLDGLAKIPELVSAAKEMDMDALALTDHGTLYGAIEFYQECRSAGLKPIIGMEAYLAPRGLDQKKGKRDADYFHLVLLAKNITGYKNLLQLTTTAHLKGYYYKPRIDKNLLKKHSQGLICLSGCLRGEIPRTLASDKYDEAKKLCQEYLSIFGKGNFYLEVQRNTKDPLQEQVNKGLVKLAEETGVPLAATADSHYLKPEDSEAQDILICVASNRTVDDPNRLDMRESELHLKSAEEMSKTFNDLPEALKNTEKITDQINLEVPLYERHFPDFPVPKGQTAATHLKTLTHNGLQKRYGEEEVPQDIRDRLEYELQVIIDKGYATYFLVVADIVNWARKRGIIVTTRGSAAGSLVAYALGVTTMNPIEFKLPFERFLNPHRPSPPDIDMDFADNRRDEVLQYISEQYGRDRVAQIVTFGTMMARAAVRDVGRALGLPYSKCDKIAKMVPFGKQGFHMSIDRALQVSPDLREAYNKDPETKKLIELAKKVEGCARHASVHAAGVVIAPKKLTEFTPLQLDTDDKHIITQYDMHSVEAAGLVKMDVLGIRNLSILGNAVEIVRATQNINVDLQDISLDDPKTYKLLSSGKTMGVFQLGGSGMTRYLMELKPSNIFDIMAMISLYRPGPMEFIPEFIKRKHNLDKIEYLDPRMKEILEDSYGVITYQDDVLLLAIKLAGYTWEEADKLRKAMGKKIPKEMAAQKEKFIQGAIDGGMSSEKAIKLWALIEPFAAYGFNKAHAASYAIVAYQTAYMKANFPVEFMAALLTAESGDNTKVAAAVNECQSLGIEVLPPDVNESLANFTVVDENHIRFGLSAIKNLGNDVIATIIKERKENGNFKNLADFVSRINSRNFNKKSWEALLKSGSLDRFGERNEMLKNTEAILDYAKRKQKQLAAGQSSLFAQSGQGVEELKLQNAKPAKEQEVLAWEKEYLGLYVSAHPLKKYEKFLKENTTTIQELSAEQENQRAVIGGILTRVKNIFTKNNDQMCFAEIEDTTGSMELVCFPNVFSEHKGLLATDGLILARGRISDKDGDLKLLVDELKSLTDDDTHQWIEQKRTNRKPLTDKRETETRQQAPDSEAKLLKVRIPANSDPGVFQNLKQIFQKHPGKANITLVIPDREGVPREVKTDFTVKNSDELKAELKQVLRQSIKQT